jgi:hypothetical protein
MRGFPVIYLRKMPKRSGKGREPEFEKISRQSIDKQDKALDIENHRQTVVSIKDAVIKRTMIQIRCDSEDDDVIL